MTAASKNSELAAAATAAKISGISSGKMAGLIEHASPSGPVAAAASLSSASAPASSVLLSPRTLSSSASFANRHYEALGGALLSSAQFFPSFAAGSFSHRSELAMFPTQPMPKLIEVWWKFLRVDWGF